VCLQNLVEHAFRSLKTVDLELRPVFHWTARRARLAVHAGLSAGHMRRSLPRLFDEPDRPPAAQRTHRWPRPALAGGAQSPANAPTGDGDRSGAQLPRCLAISPRHPHRPPRPRHPRHPTPQRRALDLLAVPTA
jgi:hypothetical protein